MKHKVYTTFDSKVGAYLQPFVMRSRGEAMRAWESVVNDPNSQFAKYPADFTLFEIAEYDEYTGMIESYEAKIPVGLALDFVRGNNNSKDLVSNDPVSRAPRLEDIRSALQQ